MGTQDESWDLTSSDGIIQALYRCISFEPGGEPKWKQLQDLFLPKGQLLKAGATPDDENPILSVRQFIEKTRAFVGESLLQRRGFVESEIMRKTEAFGRIAHVFSTYESRFADESSRLLARGTNSIQLLRKDGRWWVVSVVWDEEGQGRVIPDTYLPGSHGDPDTSP